MLKDAPKLDIKRVQEIFAMAAIGVINWTNKEAPYHVTMLEIQALAKEVIELTTYHQLQEKASADYEARIEDMQRIIDRLADRRHT